MSMWEGEDINAYLTKAMDLYNQLRKFGEEVADKTLINLAIYGLPPSYKIIIEGMNYLVNPSFNVVMGSC